MMCAAVMEFSDIKNEHASQGKFNLALHDMGRFMRLDSAAQRALNVMKQRTDANDTFSLYGVMNRGRTAMAKRLLKVGVDAWQCVGGSEAVIITESR
jgi:DNA mismatch repair protein MSH2